MPFANDCLDTIGVAPNRVPTVSVGQATCGETTLKLVDPVSGQPIDLRIYGIPAGSSSSSSSSSLSSSFCGSPTLDESGKPKHGVEIVGKSLTSDVLFAFSMMATVASEDDAALGLVAIPYNPTDTKTAGVFAAMAIVWEHGIQRVHFPFYFDISPNLYEYNPSGPLHFSEVRMAMRDVHPSENFLLDPVEYKPDEFMWAMRRPIDYWNEVPPPVCVYDPTTFPFRYHWVEAVIGELLKMAAIWLRRNDLDYSAAGLTVADTRKWPEYERMSVEHMARWQGFVRQKKIELNISGAFNSMGGYRRTIYR